MAENGGDQREVIANPESEQSSGDPHDKDRRTKGLIHLGSGGGLTGALYAASRFFDHPYDGWVFALGVICAAITTGVLFYDFYPQRRRSIVSCVSIFAFIVLLGIGIWTNEVQNRQVLPQPERRALVKLGNKDGKIGELIPPSPECKCPTTALTIYFHNSGPAIATRFNAAFVDSKTVFMRRMKSRKNNSISTSGKQAIIGVGEDFSITEQVDTDWVRKAQATDGIAILFKPGFYEYCDENNTRNCKLFTLLFEHHLDRIFPLEMKCLPAVLPSPTPDFEYLNPCEGLDE